MHSHGFYGEDYLPGADAYRLTAGWDQRLFVESASIQIPPLSKRD
jgi:hypothetical protein